jgi:hypothetical protein
MMTERGMNMHSIIHDAALEEFRRRYPEWRDTLAIQDMCVTMFEAGYRYAAPPIKPLRADQQTASTQTEMERERKG